MTISSLDATLNRRTLIAGTTAALAATATSRTGSGHTAHQATPAASPITQPDMRGAIHAFQIGDFSCHAISDGASISPETVGLLFAGSPPEDVEEAVNATGVDLSTMVSHHTPVMVDTGDQLVLIDTGFGPGFTPTDGFLLENLQQHGTAPEDIDVVIITHGHPDHIGANADAGGNPTFPNARYVITQTDWDFWTDDAQVEEAVPVPDFREILLSFAHRHLTPLEAQFDLIDYGDEIVPGISSVAAPGHTPGHMVVVVESAGERLWIGGDAAISPLNLPFPNLVGLPDIDPEQMYETRIEILARMAKDGGLVSFYHFDPFPSLGHVVADGDTWAWEPLSIDTATPAP